MSEEIQKDISSSGKKGKSQETIRTMPEYFRSGKYLKYREAGPPKKSVTSSPKKVVEPANSKKNALIFVGLAFVLLLVLGGGGYYFWQIQKNNAVADPNIDEELRLQEELRRQQEEAQAEEQKAAQEQAEQEARIARDEQRIKDIFAIQNALEEYFTQANSYPSDVIAGDSINFEGTIYLASVPIDPMPEISSYSYSVAPLDQLSYTLTFSMEVGVLGVEQGLITVSSEKQLQEDGTIITIPTKRTEVQQGQLLLPSEDTDQDGLTDVEETLLYTTNKDEFDSDFDTFSDKQELLNLYNPFGNAPILLIDSGNVDEYANEEFAYKVFYPQKWVYKALDGSNREVIFTSTTGEFIEVLVDDNIENLTLEEWYGKQFGQEELEKASTVLTHKEVLTGIRSFDRRNVYFLVNNKIYGLIHNIGAKQLIDYGVTFDMMVKSFRVEKLELPTTNENSGSTSNTTSDDATSTNASADEQNSENSEEVDTVDSAVSNSNDEQESGTDAQSTSTANTEAN